MVAVGAKSTPYDGIPREASSSTLRRRSAKRSSDGIRLSSPPRLAACATRGRAGPLVDLGDLDLTGAARAHDVDGVTDAVTEQCLADRRLHRDPALCDINFRRPDNRERLLAEVILDLNS